MSWIDLFDRLEMTALGTTIKESLWYFPAIEAVHLIGLAMLGGAILMVDLRMLGFGLRQQPVAYVARVAQPWLITSIILMLLTGVPLFVSEAVKCYYNASFWVKMIALGVGLVFTFGVRNRVARSESVSGIVQKLVGIFSISVWLVVAAAGRWIGFS